MIDVHELARLTAKWSEQLGASSGRRALLLKLSAGLSLAVASPALAGNDEPSVPINSAHAHIGDYSGIWHSRYLYSSTGRDGEFVGEHYVVARHHDNRLVCQNLPHTTGSQLQVELFIDAPVATGTWREITSPTRVLQGGYLS